MLVNGFQRDAMLHVTGVVFFSGLNRDIGRDRGEDRVSVRCHSGSNRGDSVLR
ncbi:hypothetical protein HanRHA438_Chr01g0002141 [Helianthus annuus]|nr:hypothetical protein HanRHA438_Chr01g0002141 [Helianthus annuus]